MHADRGGASARLEGDMTGIVEEADLPTNAADEQVAEELLVGGGA